MPFLEQKDGSRIYYEICGEGSPLLLLHGLCADGASWLGVRRQLARRHTLIIPDNRLSGQSSCPNPEGATLDMLVKDVKALLDSLQIQKTAVAGHSMGGLAAMQLALEYPQSTSALILESATASFYKRDCAFFLAMSDFLDKEGYTETFWRIFFPWLLAPSVYESRPELAEMAVKAARDYPYLPTPKNFRRMVGILEKAGNRAEALKGLRLPCLVISGEEDALVPPSKCRELAKLIAGSKFVLARRTGHTVHFEAPELFARRVAAFLAKNAA